MTPIDILLEGERRGILTPYHAELLREARRRNMAPGPLRATEEERAMSAGDYGTGIAAAAKRGLAALGEGLQFAGRAAPVVGGVASLLGIAPAIKESSEAVEKESRENLPKGLIERERERQRLAAAAGAKSGEYSRILPEAGAYIKQTATDPALLLSFLAEQAPALGVQAGIAQLVKRGATARGVREGMSREAAEQAAIKPATTAALASGVGLQTASVGSETEQEAYKLLLAQGVPPDEAAARALAYGRQGAAGAGAISLASQFLPGGRSLERALAGQTSKLGMLGGAIRGGIAGVPSETVEEGGGAAFKNLTLQPIDPTRSLMDGVGEAVGAAAVGSLTMGGAAGALTARGAPTRQGAEADIARYQQIQQERAAQDVAAQQAEAAQREAWKNARTAELGQLTDDELAQFRTTLNERRKAEPPGEGLHDLNSLNRLAREEFQRRREAAAQQAVAPEVAPEVAPTEGFEVFEEAPPTAPVQPTAPSAVFKTSKGSSYAMFPDGTTQREKAARDLPGHEGDKGPKARSVRTVYFDADASPLSAAGLTLPEGAKPRVVLKDGTATLTWIVNGKRGAAKAGTKVPFFTEPAVGRFPLELWQPRKDVPGYEAYSGMHAGSQIVEIGEAPKAEAPTAEAPAAEAPTVETPPEEVPGALTEDEVRGIAESNRKSITSYLPWFRKNVIGRTPAQVRELTTADPTLLEGKTARAQVLRTIIAEAKPEPTDVATDAERGTDQSGVEVPVGTGQERGAAGVPEGTGAPVGGRLERPTDEAGVGDVPAPEVPAALDTLSDEQLDAAYNAASDRYSAIIQQRQALKTSKNRIPSKNSPARAQYDALSEAAPRAQAEARRIYAEKERREKAAAPAARWNDMEDMPFDKLPKALQERWAKAVAEDKATGELAAQIADDAAIDQETQAKPKGKRKGKGPEEEVVEQQYREVTDKEEDFTPEEVQFLKDNNLSAAFESIIDRLQGSVQAALAERLQFLLANTNVIVQKDLKNDKGERILGASNINGTGIWLDSVGGMNVETLLHEGIHAATERLLRVPRDQLTERQREAIKELEALWNAAKKNANIPLTKAARESLNEFMAESLSSRIVQKALDAEPWQASTYWESFKSILLRIMGVKTPKTMSDSTARALDALFVAVKPAPAGVQSTTKVPQAKPKPTPKAGRTALGLYSALADNVNKLQMKVGDANSWKNAFQGLVNKGLVKQDEIEWSGVLDFIKLQPGKVTKEQVAEYLRQGGVQVEETVLGNAKGFTQEMQERLDELEEMSDRTDEEDAERQRLISAENAASDERGDTNQTKYDKYTLPGGENYREVLLTLPAPGVKMNEHFKLYDESGEVVASGMWPPSERTRKMIEANPSWRVERMKRPDHKDATEKGAYRSQHWDQLNVLAHIRMNDRTDADGKRVLFVEEIQSDWGQEGKKEGFKGEPQFIAGMEGDPAGFIGANDSGVPKAPFVTARKFAVFKDGKEVTRTDASGREVKQRYGSLEEAQTAAKKTGGEARDLGLQDNTEGWLNLALKRVITMAAEGGYDRVAFTTGQQNAERFSLDKHLREIAYEPAGDGKYEITATDLQGREVISEDEVGLDRIEELVGKEIAEKVARDEGERDAEGYREWRYLRGDNLKVEAKGMRAFYDTIVPTALKKLLPKVGGERVIEVNLLKDSMRKWDRALMKDDLKRLGEAGFRAKYAHDSQPGFDITDAMREKVEEGIALFQQQRPQAKPLQTDTPEFRRWFGDSKVVDENGEPLVVYHGTVGDFTQFDAARAGQTSGNRTAGWGFFFSSSPQVAEIFAGRRTKLVSKPEWASTTPEGLDRLRVAFGLKPKNVRRVQTKEAQFKDTFSEGSNLMSSYLSVKNPKELSAEEFINRFVSGTENAQRFVEQVKKDGHDGIVIRAGIAERYNWEGSEYAADAWVAFEPTQIKSATGNIGTFDPTDPDIRYQQQRPQPESEKLYHRSSMPELKSIGVGETFTLTPGPQGAEGRGVYFSQSQPVRPTTAEGTRALGQTAIIVMQRPAKDGWFVSKLGKTKKFGKPQTWHTDNKEISFKVTKVTEVNGERIIDVVPTSDWVRSTTPETTKVSQQQRPQPLSPALQSLLNSLPPQQRTGVRTLLNNTLPGMTPTGQIVQEPSWMTKFRTRAADRAATLAERLTGQFDRGVQDSFKNLDLEVQRRQAEAAGNLLTQFFKQGSLRYDPQLAQYRIYENPEVPSTAAVFDKIKQWGDARNLSTDEASQKLSELFEAARLREMVRSNANPNPASRTNFSIHRPIPWIDANAATYDADPVVQEMVRMMDTGRKALIDQMVAAGRITRQEGQDWKDAVAYVPFDRQAMDTAFGNFRKHRRAGTGLAQLGKLPELKGSIDRPINNVFENHINVMGWMVDQTVKNKANVRTLLELKRMGYAAQYPPDSYLVKQNRERAVITYIDGAPTAFILPSVYDAMAFVDNMPPLQGFFEYLGKISHVLRTAITALPTFSTSQIVQDVQRAAAYSGITDVAALTGRALENFASVSMSEVAGKEHPAVKLFGSMGIVGQVDWTEAEPAKALLQELKVKPRGRVREAIYRLEAVSRAADLSVRKAIYEQSLAEGASELQAIYRAREFINFRRKGAGWRNGWYQSLARTIAFFNAYVQGMDVLYRTLSGKEAVSGADRKQALKMLGSRAMIMLSLGMLYAMGSSGDDEYDNMTLRERDRSWVLGNGLSLPAPTELAMIFKAIPERIWDYMRRRGTPEEQRASVAVSSWLKAAGEEYAGRMIPIASATRPVLETWMNYSFFTGRPIVGKYQSELPGYMQGTGRTSEFAKTVSQWTLETLKLDVSAADIDHLMQGYLGTTAAIVTSVLDAAINPDRADRPLHQIVGITPFTYNRIGTQRKDEFYELAEKVNKAKVAVDKLSKGDPQIAEKFYNENKDKYELYAMVASTLQQYKDTRAFINWLDSADSAKSYTQDERRNLREQAQRYEIELARWVREYGKNID